MFFITALMYFCALIRSCFESDSIFCISSPNNTLYVSLAIIFCRSVSLIGPDVRITPSFTNSLIILLTFSVILITSFIISGSNGSFCISDNLAYWIGDFSEIAINT